MAEKPVPAAMIFAKVEPNFELLVESLCCPIRLDAMARLAAGDHFSPFSLRLRIMFPGRRLLVTATALCVAVTLTLSIAHAENFTWTGGGDGSTWNQAANWSASAGGSFPTLGDDATFQSNATITSGGVDSVQIDPGVILRLKADSQTVVDQWMNNQGVLTFQIDNDNTLSGIDTTYKIHNPVIFSGGGQVILNGSETGFRGDGTLINVDNLIRGSGAIDANVVNQNVIRVEGGAIALGGFHTINNHIGQVEIESDGQVELGVSSKIQGGTVIASAGASHSGGTLQDLTIFGPLNHGGTTLRDVTNTDVLTLNTDSRTRLEGTIVNQGTLTFVPDTLNTISNVDTAYQIYGNASLEGGGQVALQGSETGFVSAGVLTNVDNTIIGNGSFSLNVINQGTISPGPATEFATGLITINGFLDLTETSVLDFELGGFVPETDYDVIRVFDDVELDGTLDVDLLLSFSDPIDALDTFTILESNDLTGAFLNVANGGTMLTSDGGYQVQVNYGIGSAFLERHVVLSNIVATHMPEPSSLGFALAVIPFASLRRKRRT